MKYHVSVIVPVYNAEKYLQKCLDTLVNQTLDRIEIIAVNDCSPDNSLEILKNYQSKYGDKFQIINSPVNLKQGGARNLGIKKARGEYIGFVDPDDYVALDMFEKMYKVAKENEADIVTCDYFEVIGEEKIYRVNDLPEGNINKEVLKKILQRKYGWELWQQIYKKNLFIDNNIQFSENLYVTDLEIGGLIIMYANKINKVKEPLYYYVKHENATTSFKLNDKKIYDLITISDKRLQHFKNRNFYNEFKEELDYVYFWHVGVVSVFRCVNNFSKPQYNKIEELKMKLKYTIPDIKNNYYYKKSNIGVKILYFLLNRNKYVLVGILKIIMLIPPKLKNKMKNVIKKG